MTETDPTVPEPVTDPHARPSATGKGRVTALDGLRAFAVVLVMFFHFGVGWLQGGFFGVDIFYVLSGYLITGLLTAEYRRRGVIRLGDFWMRRARRLLPALLIVLVAVTLLVRFVAPSGMYPDFRMGALSALFYYSNWWQIAVSGSYFVATSPASPLAHTWSLAVEEQFYLVWPLVVLAVMHFSRTFARGVRVLMVVSVVGTLASAVEMALRYNPRFNTTRLYFGTDTHAQSILIGSVLACVMTLSQMGRNGEGMDPDARPPVVRRILDLAGVLGVVGLVVMSATLVGTSAFTYQGGFALCGLCAAAVIAAAVSVPGGVVASVFSLRPLIWLGTISYGVYLWHFPVFVFVDSYRTGVDGLALLVIRFGCTLGLASASYYLVERPVIERRFWRSAKAVLPAVALVAVTVVVVVVGTVVPSEAAPVVHRFVPRSAARMPPKVVVLGDSTALTLGYALDATAPAGTAVTLGGLFGCGLAVAANASNNPPTPELTMFPACNESTPPSGQWPALDTATVRTTGPGDLVLFVAGNWEAQDLLRNGRWTNIESPAFQRYEVAQMRKAVEIGTAHGARFAFTTMPAMAGGAAFHEPAFPEDSPRRRMIYNRLIALVAAEFPGKAGVVDLGHILTPQGVFTEFIDGVQVRVHDGVHTPSFAPGNVFVENSTPAEAYTFYNWLSPRIWPLLVKAADAPG